jgi:hypothetical protein
MPEREELEDKVVGGKEVVVSKYPSVPDYDEDLTFSTVDDAINTYVATRDDLDRERKAYNKYEATAKNYMGRIEMWLKEKADELGVESFRTKSGTAYRTVKTSYRKETGNFQCLEKRAAKNAVKEVHDETGEIPPGLEYHAEIEFDVRRPSK